VTMQTSCQCPACASRRGNGSSAERPRYYPRQLITPGDMTLEQDYFRDKLRRHNRMLHGWGVVCGAMVCPVAAAAGASPSTTAWTVRVTLGYVLGPYGDEIIIDKETTVNLQTSGGTSAPAGADDPWCTPVYTPRDASGSLYIAVKYAETQTRPVRIQSAGCGSDMTSCEASRWCDSFEIGVLDTLPASYQNGNWSAPDRTALVPRILPTCSPCPTDPWVLLASVETDSQGVINKIDNCSWRRVVLSFADFWWQCTPLVIASATQQRATVSGTTTLTVTVNGTGFSKQATITLGKGITDIKVNVNDAGTQMTVTATLGPDAAANVLPLTVTNPDCSSATFSVPAPSAPTPPPPST
jgi:hypothetical protein